jgi:hypothetical protein
MRRRSFELKRRDSSQKEVHTPVVHMLSIADDRPPFTFQELYAMGYPLIIEA